MAIQGPVGKDNMDISFRLQTKSQLFDGSNNAFQNAKTDIVASASCHGIVFVGSSNAELLVACLKDLESADSVEKNVPIRKLNLPSPTTNIATNCDGSLLAVVVKLSGTPHIQLYSVQSFLTPNIQKVREFRLSNDNSDALQLCWNPVMTTTLALITDSGALNTYTLKDTGIEFHSTDPNYKAKCCCWSPKGKQIVAGFANGKLAQFTPELKPAKIIDWPPGTFTGSFDTIAIQWLSTFQFAVAFLNHQPESRPVLHIVNAPKAGPPQYIAYSDVCYSSNEIRPSKIYLKHIMQWNMLLVASSNAIDVSFLRITQPGDLPVWTQESPNDSYTAELPLTPSKDESFPLGFELETGCSGRLLQEDGKPYPVMPMIHVLSTAGALCSFYVLNTMSSFVDICSPPRPIDGAALGLFTAQQVQTVPDVMKTPPKPEIQFAPQIQSTPAPVPKAPQPTKPQPVFGGFSLPATTQQPPTFAPTAAFQTVAKTTAPIVAPTPTPVVTQAKPPQALITVPQTFTPQTKQETPIAPKPADKTSSAEDEQVYTRLIQDEMKAFELELRAVMEKSRSLKVNIGTKEESAEMRRNIEELDELKKEATETIESLRTDVQSNRLGLTEMFSMVYEAKAKFDQAKNEKSIFMHGSQVQDRASKRTLDRLVKQVAQCEMQLQMAVQVMNAQWANYQEAMSKSKRNRMHNPSLEGLYQTLTKQQEIIYRQNEKMAVLKARLGLREGNMKAQVNNATLESFSDSMITISLADQVQSENAKLTNKKLKNLRNILSNRDVVTIKPQRPERSGLNSEIIREKKLEVLKKLKKPGATSVVPKLQTSVVAPQASVPSFSASSGFSQPQPQPKPSATVPSSTQQKPVSFGGQAASGAAPISFGTAKKPEDTPKPAFGFSSAPQGSSGFGVLSSTAPSFGVPSSTAPSFGVPSSTAPSFGVPSSAAQTFGVPSSAAPSFGVPSSTAPSFGVPSSTAPSFGVPSLTAPSFGVPSSTAPSFGVPSSTVQPFGVSSTSSSTAPSFGTTPSSQPSFSFSSTPLVMSTDKKKEEGAPRLFINPVAQKATEAAAKPPSTIADTKIAVSATFSIPLANKVSPSGQKEPSRVVEKKPDESKTESASFTFKLADKKEGSNVPVVNVPANQSNISSLLAGAGDNKGFSFGSGNTSSPFGASSAFSVKAPSKPTATTTSSVFSGFGSSPAVTTSGTSIFGSGASTFTGFGTGLSAAASGDGDKTSSSTVPFSLNLTPSSEATKTETKPATGSFSFASIATPSTTSDVKPAAATTTVASIKPTPVSSSFSFGVALTSSKPSETSTTSTASSFSFGAALQASPTTPTPVSSTPAVSTTTPTVSSSTPSSQPEPAKPQSDLPPLNLKICSPNTKPQVSEAASGNVFATAAKADTSSLFSSSSFGAALASTQSSVFGAAPSSTQVTSSLASALTTTPSQSLVFGSPAPSVTPAAPAAAASPSIFGSLSLSDANKQTSPSSPPTGLFSSLVKPDQSVFGQPAATSASPFGGGFGSATSQSSVFGTPSTTTASSIFGGSPSVFGAATTQSSAFGQSPSIFAQQGSAPATVGSLFSQSSFGTPATTAAATGIFGASQTTSPFGASSVFGSGQTQSPQPSGGSMFGGQSTFGANTSQGSIFGGGGVTNTASPFGSASVFGGGSSFSSPGNAFGGVQQSGFGAAAASQPAFGQAPSFGSQATFGGSATFGSPKSSIFGQASTTGQSNSLFEQLGSQQTSGNLFGQMTQTQPQQQQPPQGGFQGSAFSSWR